MARAPRASVAESRLEPLLGPGGCARLQAVLLARAATWAATHGTPFVAFTPDDAAEEVSALVGGATLFPQRGAHLGERLTHALGEAAARTGASTVVVGTDQPALSAAHVAAVRDDLDDGVDVCFGPATDGGCYLLAAREPHPALFAIEPEAWGGPEVLQRSLEAVVGAGLSIGWLRSERALDEPADAAALLADPCAPGDVVAALRLSKVPGGSPVVHPDR